MYPYARFFKEALKARAATPLTPLETHISQHVCWPWDIDPWMEMNNGRTLTLYDLGRVGLSIRCGLFKALRQNRWGMVVAGASVRYRRRITVFSPFEMRSRCVGWDGRFMYLDQSMWQGDECSSQVLIRGAVTSKGGMVAPERLIAAMDPSLTSPELPAWVQNWAEADNTRPWPPQA